jgi:NAD(P)-dependent dehydrogenase (short-subunit alcohol dehydrogenase family)
MTEPRSVVITGASRGLGFASAVYLYKRGWRVVAAMRTPDTAMEHLRSETGASPDDPRLTGVRLDLTDPPSIAAAAEAITDAVGAPYGLVHNAGFTAVGCVEELPFDVMERILATNLVGAARLTAALLPSMRAAGEGRIVVISSEAAIHGMPGIAAYAASKGGLERWAEGLSLEVSPFGIGVSVLVTGTFDTDVLDHEHTTNYGDPAGPYGYLHRGQAKLEARVKRMASPTDRFPPALERALEADAPFVRRTVGPDAAGMRAARTVLGTRLFQRMVSRVLSIPKPGALSDDPIRLTVPEADASVPKDPAD